MTQEFIILTRVVKISSIESNIPHFYNIFVADLAFVTKIVSFLEFSLSALQFVICMHFLTKVEGPHF